MRCSRYKKAQMEMVGLVVIVILITIGMLLLVSFGLKKGVEDKKIFTRKGLAASTTSAILKTTITEAGCQGYSLGEDLIEDCAKYFGEKSSSYSCNNKHSCEFVEEKIKILLNETLGVWNKRYQFDSRLFTAPDQRENFETLIKIESARGNCKGRDTDTSGSFFLNTQVGLVETSLFVCD